MKIYAVGLAKVTRVFSYLLFTATLLSSCHSSDAYAQHHINHRALEGNVSSIEIIAVESRTSGGGAVLGAVLGGVIGHQLGGGRGRDLATGTGVVAGAMVGNQVEHHNRSESEVYRVTVKLDNGRTQEFDYKEIDDLRVGDRVRIKDGQIYQN